MAVNRLKLKTSPKIDVCKNLFGVNDEKTNVHIATEPIVSPLEEIWGESEILSFTQPTNSLLLSPALKRNPNRFSNSSNPSKSPGTPNKKISPSRKLSKYSPFRKKVYNANPNNSIKKFFSVKEVVSSQASNEYDQNNPLGIEKLRSAQPSTSKNSFDSVSSHKSENLEISNPVNTNATLSNKSFTSFPNANPTKTPTKMTTAGGSTSENSNTSTPQSGKKNLSPTSKITGKKDVYAEFLLRILFEIVINDANPGSVQLFSEDEYKHIRAFNRFDRPSQRLYARLLNRKLKWIRKTDMKYGDIDLQLMLLEQQGFITTDYSEEGVENLLNLLKVPELKNLCKSYKMPESGVKSDLVSRLISRSRQPSIKTFFTKGVNISDGEQNLRSKIYELLGLVIKVEQEPQETFARCLLFFSYPHYHGLERDRFSDQLALVSQFNNLSFPEYEVVRTTIFHTRDNFLAYEAALIESSQLSEEKEIKNWDMALQLLRDIAKKLKSLLADDTIRLEIEATPDFLRRFTVCACYVRAVSSSTDVFKKWEHSRREAEEALELLLSQQLISQHRRGQWYEQLALLHQHNFKDNVKATQVVLRGLRDEYIDVVSRHILSARATMLEGRKTNGLKDYLKDALAKQRSLIEILDTPPSVTISEQVLASCRQGLKQVYVHDSKDGKMLSSVEEVAKEHFKQEGYSHGVHDEGSLIKSVIFACFWDEIYSDSVTDGHSLFHSEYQTYPLDWNCESFFERRKEKIRKKLQDFGEGGVEAVLNCYVECSMKNFNRESVVKWNYLEHYEIVESFIRSINIDVFLGIARLLLKEHKTFAAGFPDLTLWDPSEKKCLFVEVKSPNDQLSMKQRVWLHNLNRMGANARVCHVQSVGCKSKKRKASPTKEET